MNKEERLAKDMTNAVGGNRNIDNIIHCMTRVRIKIHDYDKVNYNELKSIDGVLGVVEDERLQVVVGPGIVNKVANYMSESYKAQAEEQARQNKQNFQSHRKQSKRNKVLKSIANIFIPLIPAFIGSGLIGGIAAILNNLLTAGTLSGDWLKQVVSVLSVIKDGMLA